MSEDLETDPVPQPAQTKPKAVRRHVLIRLFGISVWGWFKLTLLCILVGFFVMVAQYEPEKANISVVEALGRFLRSVLAMTGWAAQNFWQPALAGASVVLPIWVLWRVISLPFRK